MARTTDDLNKIMLNKKKLEIWQKFTGNTNIPIIYKKYSLWKKQRFPDRLVLYGVAQNKLRKLFKSQYNLISGYLMKYTNMELQNVKRLF